MHRFRWSTGCFWRGSCSRWDWPDCWCGVILIFILMSIEVMLNAAGLAFVVAGSRWGQADGQVMFMFILAMAAAEVSVGLGSGAAALPPVQVAGCRCGQRDERLTDAAIACG